MKPVRPFDWNVSPDEARALQSAWAPDVITTDGFGAVARIAGVDASYDDAAGMAQAAVAVLDAATLNVIETKIICVPCHFPYVPHLLSFRELPAVIAALEALQCVPDLIVCDGHGRAHARRFGLACHLGVLFDVATIGCAKTRLTGTGPMPGTARASQSDLVSRGEVVGRILRTRTNTRPVFVSVGHRISLDTACAWILRLSPQFRLPETTRAADKLSRAPTV
jgi:deoxyribonuclease V